MRPIEVGEALARAVEQGGAVERRLQQRAAAERRCEREEHLASKPHSPAWVPRSLSREKMLLKIMDSK
jgi:hypothetical protein